MQNFCNPGSRMQKNAELSPLHPYRSPQTRGHAAKLPAVHALAASLVTATVSWTPR
jgi:hypothetical protein